MRIRNSWGHSLRSDTILVGFPLQEFHRVLTTRIQKRFSSLRQWEAKKNHCETSPDLFRNQGLLSRRKDFVRAQLSNLTPAGGKGSPACCNFQLSCFTWGGRGNSTTQSTWNWASRKYTGNNVGRGGRREKRDKSYTTGQTIVKVTAMRHRPFKIWDLIKRL